MISKMKGCFYMIKNIEHVAIIASDLEQSIDFYANILGFSLRTRGKKGEQREIAFLNLRDNPMVEIELIQDLVQGDVYSNKGIVNHLAFRVENIDEAISNYKEKGVVFTLNEPTISIDGFKTIFFHGPNSELLQLIGN